MRVGSTRAPARIRADARAQETLRSTGCYYGDMNRTGSDTGFVRIDGEACPELLRHVSGPPAGLFVRGKLEAGARYIAVVGTRRATAYGEQTAARIAAGLARAGFCVVSGLALGIDSAAHRGALEAGGRTVAVLGTGVDVVYPWRNRGLAERIARSGALVSEYPMGSSPQRWTFVGRNRIVAGMCPITVVVESPAGGGAMITAGFAAEQGRTVCAVPGRVDQPTSAGCHALIRDGATLVTSAAEVLEELGYGAPPQLELPMPAAETGADGFSTDEQAILQALKDGALLGLDGLAARTSVPAPRLMPSLMLLELKGRLRKRPDGTFERIR